MCLNGPSSPNLKGKPPWNAKLYQAIFLNIIEQIRAGRYTAHDVDNTYQEYGSEDCEPGDNPSIEKCPFSQ